MGVLDQDSPYWSSTPPRAAPIVPGLSPRDRSLATVTALITGGNTEQLEFHLPYAIENGVTPDELVELITHLAFYAGWPKAISVHTVAKRLLAADHQEN